MRVWLSGPRMFGGLIRPGISFSTAELRKKKPPIRRAIARELPASAAAPALDEPSPFHARSAVPAGKRKPVCVHAVAVPPEPKPPLWMHIAAWTIVTGGVAIVASVVFITGGVALLIAPPIQ